MANLKNTIVNDTGNLTLPVGSTAQRPTPSVGQTRFNSTLGVMEYYGASGWTPTAQVRDGSANNATSAVLSMTDFDILKRPAGNYFFIKPGDPAFTPTIVSLYYSGHNYNGSGFGWVKLFESPYNGTATTNLINQNYFMKEYLVGRSDGSIWETAGWNDTNYGRPFNTRNTTGDLSTTGTRIGYRVFFGYSGGMGIYNTGQTPCFWATASGAIGAGYDGGSCGSFPNGLLWGTGNGINAVYDNRSGTWSIWGRWL
jgi:hypothetical protein